MKFLEIYDLITENKTLIALDKIASCSNETVADIEELDYEECVTIYMTNGCIHRCYPDSYEKFKKDLLEVIDSNRCVMAMV